MALRVLTLLDIIGNDIPDHINTLFDSLAEYGLYLLLAVNSEIRKIDVCPATCCASVTAGEQPPLR